MYVCICHAITEKDIQKATDQGVVSLQELSQHTGVGTQCGACLSHSQEVMRRCRRRL
ncbi:MAG: glycoprotein [Cyanobacteria bacterium RI_101]|nr:glycoprotein [Cyanobacteria bacterium RI_101]